MRSEGKIVVGIAVVTLLILIGGVFFLSQPGGKNTPTPVNESILLRNTTRSVKAQSAGVTIVEFADYQCPACARVQPILKQLLSEYEGKVTFVYRHFPLPQHTNAIPAARAAEAAGEQGKFWEMSALLYERQLEWSESSSPEEIFMSYAKEIGLDTKVFEEDIRSEKYDESIEQDKKDGEALGVNSTPTLYIENVKFTDAPTYENLKKYIDGELAKTGEK